MQKKQPNRNLNIRNRYSKFKEWCTLHSVPPFLFPIVLFIVFATVAVLVGGAIAGWNIGKALTSSTAVLAYVLIGVGILGAIYYFLVYKPNRW